MKSIEKSLLCSPKIYQLVVLGICWLGGVFAGMDANLFSVMMQAVISDIAKNPEQAKILSLGSYLLSSFLIGWMVGGILMGIASDHFGRVKTLAFSIFLYASFTGLASYVQSIPELACCRFVTGLGVGGTMVGISIFLSETWTSSSRAVALALLVTSYQVGVLLSGTLAHLCPDWRLAFSTGAIPVFLAFGVATYFENL